jgi:hypothetical protein
MVLATEASVASSRGDVRDATARHDSDQQQDGHAAGGSSSAHQMKGDGNVQQPEEDDEVALFFVEAVYPYRGQEANHLNFDKRDLIEVWGQDATGWWDGFLVQSTLDDHRGKRGWFPSSKSYMQPCGARDPRHNAVGRSNPRRREGCIY